MKSATETYEENRARVRRALDQLERRLAEHRDRFAAEQGNWGYPADLGRVAEVLEQHVCELLVEVPDHG